MNTRPTPETDDSKTRVRKNGFSRLIEYCYANDMAKIERELATVTAQRDRLAEALETITITGSAQYCREIADEALQSLTQKP
jgi:hypothetical protein